MSGRGKKGGGEAVAAHLLRLARRELLEVVLPALEGDERYRARLIANAMKIAARDCELGAGFDAETAGDLEAFAARVADEKPVGIEDAGGAIRDALRSGRLDASPALYELLGAVTQRRRTLLG